MPSYVVAGASRGIGLEFVKQLLARGDIVIALARDPSAKGLTAIEDKNLHIVKADTTDAEALKAAADETAKITGGSLDVLINNAGVQDMRYTFLNITQYPDANTLRNDFNKTFTTNVLGPILTTNAFLPLLRKGAIKKVLTLSSGLGDAEMNLKAEYANQVPYCVTKQSLEMVNVKYAVALKDEGFTFLAVGPGAVHTLEGPPPPEAMPGIIKMVGSLKKVYPDWSGVPMEPFESVALMLGIVDKMTQEDNGKFISHKGNKEWL